MNKGIILAALAIAGPACAQGGPPPLVEAYTPNGMVSSSTYDCSGTHVKLEFFARNNIVAVNKYVFGSKKLTKLEIEKWNGFLQPLKSIDSYQFLCGRTVSSIVFTGPSSVPGKSSVSVYVEDGKVRPIRLIN